MLKEKKKKLPSESGNNAAESFKFLNILTRQGRQLRMLRVLTRERTRKTHRTFYFRIFCSIHFVGYPVQIVQLYFGKTFRIAISWAAFCFARCRKSTGTWIAQEPGTNRRGTRSIFLVITRSRGIIFSQAHVALSTEVITNTVTKRIPKQTFNLTYWKKNCGDVRLGRSLRSETIHLNF